MYGNESEDNRKGGKVIALGRGFACTTYRVTGESTLVQIRGRKKGVFERIGEDLAPSTSGTVLFHCLARSQLEERDFWFWFSFCVICGRRSDTEIGSGRVVIESFAQCTVGMYGRSVHSLGFHTSNDSLS